MTAPTVDLTVLRRQQLVDTAVELTEDPSPDLIAVVRDRLLHRTGVGAIELHALLWAAAHRDGDRLDLFLIDVYERQQAVQRHGQTEHGECCQGECLCAQRAALARCGDCETKPHELLDEGVRQLVWFLRGAVADSAVTAVLGGAA